MWDTIKVIAALLFVTFFLTGVLFIFILPKHYDPPLLLFIGTGILPWAFLFFLGGLKAAKKDKSKGGLVLAICSFVALSAAVVYVWQEFHHASDTKMALSQFESSLSVRLNSIVTNSGAIAQPPVKPSVKIWKLKNGMFSDKERDELAKLSEKERYEQVQAIAMIKESTQETGKHYAEDLFLIKRGTGIKAVTYIWDVTIVDMNQQRATATAVLRGPAPPEKISTKSIKEDVVGIRPDDEYESWLNSLPLVDNSRK